MNLCKTLYLLGALSARLVPNWDLFHKRWNISANALTRCDIWHSIKQTSERDL